jgi:hypothetical protein
MRKLIYITLLLVVGAAPAYPQAGNTIQETKKPVLNEHVFPSFHNFSSPFVNTSLRADIGFGTTSLLKIPGIEIDDYEIFAFEGKLLFVNLNVQYQQKFTDWLALFLTFKMAGRLGTDMSTILADGVNTLNGGEIGWLIRILHKEKFYLSGSVYVSNLNGSFINVTQYFEEIINNNPYPSLVKKAPAMIIGGGIHGAYAFNPSFGLQFDALYGYGESFKREKTQGYFSGGLMGDVDFFPKYKVPVSLAIGYTISTAPAIVMSDGGSSNLFIGKISYSGGNDYELGLQYTYYNTKLTSVDQKPYISRFTLGLKFYF